MNTREIARRTVRLEIIRLPDFLKTFAAIDPAHLQRHTLKEVETTEDAAAIGEALEAFEKSEPHPASDPCDARASLRFIDATGANVLEVVFSPLNLRGTVDEKPVAFTWPTLGAWLYARYPAVRVDA